MIRQMTALTPAFLRSSGLVGRQIVSQSTGGSVALPVGVRVFSFSERKTKLEFAKSSISKQGISVPVRMVLYEIYIIYIV